MAQILAKASFNTSVLECTHVIKLVKLQTNKFPLQTKEKQVVALIYVNSHLHTFCQLDWNTYLSCPKRESDLWIYSKYINSIN